MKKEIENLLKSENGNLKINDYFTLERYTKDALENEVDVLKLISSLTSYASETTEISARDFEGIKREVIIAMANHIENAKYKMIKNFENGYLH